ncbi:malate dehydrogenase [Roseofilum sp. BLCC_M154]|uniref:Malate dehydrogenase n=1 Tax=Roseofilum acuticapitatum BLCC-M154 TaxID=3022444 RepID=A0ABT7AMG2_9CYAN|nr:malate dehydrogenase [Roseofilum acuticapitatum]MDJ1168087.1 malate dehydrogenase [Roseofilum acuticapitatum BLCC-M154]
MLELHQSIAPRVGIIGAGKVGSTLAQRIAEKDLADVVLLDVIEGMPQAIALDLMEARGVERHDRQLIGSNDYADLVDCDIVVITAGRPRTPGMTREDLVQVNAKIVKSAVKSAIAHCPQAIFILVTNPLDVMTYLAWKASGLDPSRVMGMAGVLDSARFQTFIAFELGCSIADIQTLVLGGHGDLMVPLPRFSTVRGIPITELMDTETIDRLVDRTRKGGAEIVQLMKTGGAYYAPASSVCLMVEAMLHNQSRFMPVAGYLQGQYGLNDIYMGVPCQLGYQGIQRILELPLEEAEITALHESAKAVRKGLEMAESLVGFD